MSHTAIKQLPYTVDLNESTRKVYLDGVFVTDDHEGHQFDLYLYRGSAPVQLPSGVAVHGYFTRYSDNTTLTLKKGTVSGNVASIKLDKACYALPGQFALVIKVMEGEAISALFYAEGSMVVGNTGKVIDAGNVIPSLDELLARIADMETATAESREATADAQAAAQEARDAATDIQTQMDEYKDTVDDTLGQLNEQKAPAIECEASGTLITVNDAAAMPVHGLVSYIEPAQAGSGDPSTDNVRPVSGWDTVKAKRTGRNLIRYPFGTVTSNGVTFTSNDDGSVTISGTASGTIGQRISDDFADVFLPKGVKYHVFLADEAPNSAITLQAYIDNASKFNSQDGFLTIPETATAAYLRIRVAAGVTINDTVHPMVTIADDSSEWESGEKAMLTAKLPETVYGGTLDWKTGTLHKTYHKIELDGVTNGKKVNSAESSIEYCYISSSRFAVQTKPNGHAVSDKCAISIKKNGAMFIYIPPAVTGATSEDTVTEKVDKFNAVLKQWYDAGNPLEVVYEINTPEEYQLTPQRLDMLKGVNNVWSVCGDTSIVYAADTKMYIDSKISELVTLALANQ